MKLHEILNEENKSPLAPWMLKTRKEIEFWLNLVGLAHATIADNLTVAAYVGIILDPKLMTNIRRDRDSIFKKDKGGFLLPVQFSKIHGTFSISNVGLSSLVGSPFIVDGSYNCSGNGLYHLNGAPRKVTEEFFCYNNKLRTLYGGPTEVGSHYLCDRNSLLSLEGAPSEIGGRFDCSENRLKSLEHLPPTIKTDLDISHNNSIKSLHNIHRIVKFIGGNITIPTTVRSNILGLVKISGLKDIQFASASQRYRGPPKDLEGIENLIHATTIVSQYLKSKDIHACQEKMLEAGLKEYARL